MMKPLFFFMIAAMLFSCNPRQADNQASGGASVSRSNGRNDDSPIDSTLIPADSADVLIHNYHCYKRNYLKEVAGYSSFMLNAAALRDYLNANKDIVTLNVYLAMNNPGPMTDSSMTLVYIGAVDSAGYNVEKLYQKKDGNSYFMDHAMPCPVCEKRIEAYHPARDCE